MIKIAALLALISLQIVVNVSYKFAVNKEGKYDFEPAALLVASEGFKCILAFFQHVAALRISSTSSSSTSTPLSFSAAIAQAWSDVKSGASWKFCGLVSILSLLYCVNNNLTFAIFALADPATFQMIKSMVPAVSAVIWAAFLDHPMTEIEWAAILLQVVGLCVMQYDPCRQSTIAPPMAYVLLGISVMITSISGVFNEFMVKKLPVALGVQNFFLYFFGALVNGMAYFFLLPSEKHTLFLLRGVHGWGIVILLCNCFIGLVVTAVYKYADVNLKNFASSATTAFMVLFSIMFLSLKATLTLFFGISVVFLSAHVYFVDNVKIQPKLAAAAAAAAAEEEMDTQEEEVEGGIGGQKETTESGSDEEGESLLKKNNKPTDEGEETLLKKATIAVFPKKIEKFTVEKSSSSGSSSSKSSSSKHCLKYWMNWILRILVIATSILLIICAAWLSMSEVQSASSSVISPPSVTVWEKSDIPPPTLDLVSDPSIYFGFGIALPRSPRVSFGNFIPKPNVRLRAELVIKNQTPDSDSNSESTENKNSNSPSSSSSSSDVKLARVLWTGETMPWAIRKNFPSNSFGGPPQCRIIGNSQKRIIYHPSQPFFVVDFRNVAFSHECCGKQVQIAVVLTSENSGESVTVAANDRYNLLTATAAAAAEGELAAATNDAGECKPFSFDVSCSGKHILAIQSCSAEGGEDQCKASSSSQQSAEQPSPPLFSAGSSEGTSSISIRGGADLYSQISIKGQQCEPLALPCAIALSSLNRIEIVNHAVTVEVEMGTPESKERYMELELFCTTPKSSPPKSCGRQEADNNDNHDSIWSLSGGGASSPPSGKALRLPFNQESDLLDFESIKMTPLISCANGLLAMTIYEAEKQGNQPRVVVAQEFADISIAPVADDSDQDEDDGRDKAWSGLELFVAASKSSSSSPSSPSQDRRLATLALYGAAGAEKISVQVNEMVTIDVKKKIEEESDSNNNNNELNIIDIDVTAWCNSSLDGVFVKVKPNFDSNNNNNNNEPTQSASTTKFSFPSTCDGYMEASVSLRGQGSDRRKTILFLLRVRE